MTGTLPAPTTLAEACEHVEAALACVAPELIDGYRRHLPRAAAAVSRRLLAALYREDVADVRTRLARRGRLHGFDRMEFDPAELGRAQTGPAELDDLELDHVEAHAVAANDPVRLLRRLAPVDGATTLAAELSDAVVKLAIAYARRGVLEPVPTSRVDDRAVATERLAVEGHNLHPCGRTRLGWSVADAIAHDVEAPRTTVCFVAVARHLHVGDDITAFLADAYPDVPTPPDGYRVQPVHAWQLDMVRQRYPDLCREGVLVPLDAALPAVPTVTVRTLLLPPGRDGRHRYLKLSLDIQVTSTRRTISTASTQNGPRISRLLGRLIADDEVSDRVALMSEVGGAAVSIGDGRDLSAIVREGLDTHLALDSNEIAVPAVALPVPNPTTGRTLLASLVDRFAATRAISAPADAARAFVAEYAWVLLRPVLRLATRFGIALEAHLQNCVPTFVDGRPHRMIFRDFAGLRLHRPRLAAAGITPTLWPGSVIATDDLETMRAKLIYTALQAHLGELVLSLVRSHDLNEGAAWRTVRETVDEVYDELRADPDTADAAADDHAALTAPRVPHKALVRMRLAGSGDIYVPVTNALRSCP